MSQELTIIKLPPYNAVTGRAMTKQGHYESYSIWRKGAGYRLWRDKQWKIQKGKCYYCKASLVGRVSNVEHVVNQARWGQTAGSNMVLSCAPCNKAKGSSRASKMLRNDVSRFNHMKRTRKRSVKRKWKPLP